MDTSQRKLHEDGEQEAVASVVVGGGGGEEEENDLVEIVDSPLDLAKYVDAVRSRSAGAIATFAGTTRDTFQGRRVVLLEYESYTAMAHAQMLRICAAARLKWALTRLALAHRVGVVPVGEESVFVAASSVHRKDALEACQFAIDEIKASVPIWKKEVYDDGEVWKENSEFHGRFLHPENTLSDELTKLNEDPKKEPRRSCCGRKERASTPFSSNSEE